jgi:hypothetical protein
MVRALKVLVTVLGILLVGGVIALAAAMVSRGSSSPATAPRPASLPRGAGFNAVIDLPPGARIVSTQPEAGRLVVVLAWADGHQQVLLIDLASGARLGTIELRGGAN